MTLTAPKQQANRVLAPEGTHIARCISLIQIGTIETEYLGEKKWIEKIRLTFELPEELHSFREGEDKKPLVISQEYSHSMGSKSNLRPIIEGIIGTTLLDHEADSFDLEYIVGKPCLITIIHKESRAGTKYVAIKSTAPLMKNMAAPQQFNHSTILTYEKWNEDVFNKLPEFIKESMKTSKQYLKRFEVELEETDGEINPKDIPF